MPTILTGTPLARARSDESELSSSTRLSRATTTRAMIAGRDQRGHGVRADHEDRAEQDRERGPGRRRVQGAQVEEERGRAEGGPEHHPGGHVPAPAALHPDPLHQRGGRDPGREEAPELVEPDQERARPAGGGDVGQRMAGEGLAADDGEDADDARGDGDDGARPAARS